MNLEGNEPFFVLRDPLGYKMLLQVRHFMHYQIRENTELFCRIDKINCNGRIYLEPQNPWYIEGQTYPFEVVGSGINYHITGLPQSYYLVRDKARKIWTVKLQQNGLPQYYPDTVLCKIIRIKKGILYLRLDDGFSENSVLEQGLTYDFELLGEAVEKSSETSFYILQDVFKSRYVIKKKFYGKYNFIKGKSIKCRVDGFTDDGQVFLEPEHPAYTIGNSYPFPVVGRKEFRFSDGACQKYIVVEDMLGEEVNIPVEEASAGYWAQFNNVVCRVVDIKKSRLEVELTEGVC